MAVLGEQRRAPAPSAALEKGRADRGLGRARPDQRPIGAGAERQAEGVEQDRLAGAGLAGQHAKAARELQVEPLDQDDVADREADQHGASRSAGSRPRARSEPLRPVLPLATVPQQTVMVPARR